jgi:PhnB protein
MTGNAEEAINFYKAVFGGTTEIMRWKEMPPNPDMPLNDDWQDKIMHCTYNIDKNVTIYLSDSLVEEKPVNNTLTLHVVFDSEKELRKAFEALSIGGRVDMPVDNTFWGSVYGRLVDKSGIGWGLEFPESESSSCSPCS